MKVYHVTKKEYLNSILEKGIIPQTGERSKDCGEREELIFLFPTKEDMNFALGQWFGDCFEEDEELVSLELTLPDNFPIEEGDVEYEVISKVIIPSKYITHIREE